MTATHDSKITTKCGVLYLAFELGESGFEAGVHRRHGAKAPATVDAISGFAAASRGDRQSQKQRFQLPADAAVKSCYEAGRDGFWICTVI